MKLRSKYQKIINEFWKMKANENPIFDKIKPPTSVEIDNPIWDTSMIKYGKIYNFKEEDKLMNEEELELGWDEEYYEEDEGPEEYDMSPNEAFQYMLQLRNDPENDVPPFWTTPEFDESDFKIVDRGIQFNDDVMKMDQDSPKVRFFYEVLKPLVDHELAKSEWPNGDGISSNADRDFDRAMAILK